MPAAVEARGDGNGLAIARLEELKLAEVDGFADGVIDKGLGVGLFHRGHDLGKGDGDGRGDLGVEVVRAAIGKRDFAVDNVGVRARSRAVEGPLEFAEGERQATEGDVALGARVAQALRFGSQVRRHCREQILLVEVEGLAQFELQAAVIQAGKAKLKDLRGLTVEVGRFGGGDKLEACFGGGGFD